MNRYSLEPLAASLGVPLHSLGRRLGVSGSTWQEYRDQGVSERVADRLAVRLGVPTLSVWPEMTELAAAACAECSGSFIPNRKGHIYCSKRCRARVAQRAYHRRRRADPVFGEIERERCRRYKAESVRAVKIGRKAYYEANRERFIRYQADYRARMREAA